MNVAPTPLNIALDAGSYCAGEAGKRLSKALDDVLSHFCRLPVIRQRFIESRPLCEALFENLARTDPAELVRMIREDRLAPADLTFAAEALGSVVGDDRTVPTLLSLLEHSSPLVREGAVYGLTDHMDGNVRHALSKLARSDPSPGVRDAANETLDDS